MNFDEIKRALEDRNLLEVSKRAGVGYPALRKISKGDNRVSVRTLDRLAKYLFGESVKHG